MKIFAAKFRFLISAIIAATLLFPNLVFAGNFNMGTLDIRPTNKSETINITANPGQQIQTEFQVSNFSSQNKNLEFYLTDQDTLNQKNIQYQQQFSENNYTSNWARLATDNIILKSAESKIISLNFSIPQNAAIGNHQLAIIAREKQPGINGGNLILEKGIKINLEILGQSAPFLKIKNQSIITTDNFIVLENTIKNTGNTTLNGNMNFSLFNSENQKINEDISQIFLRPGESKNIVQKLDKPVFGLYSFGFTQDLTAQNLSFHDTRFFYPTSFNYLAFTILFGIIYLAVRRLTPKKHIKKTRQIIFSPTLIKSFSYASLVIIATISFVGLNKFLGEPMNYQANLFGEAPLLDGYNTRIRWGNLKNKEINSSYHQDWSGTISVENGKISIIKKLHNEENDSIRLVSTNELKFNHQTGADNDGIELLIEPTTRDLIPVLVYFDSELNRYYRFSLNDLANKNILISKKLHAFDIKTTPAPQTGRNQNLPLSTDRFSTTELESTEEINNLLEATPDLSDDFEVLKEIFEDIPATSEILTEYILNSEYVETIQTSKEITEIKADSELINTLAILPETIEEITATPELNFIFIPDEKIRFTPQQFSFSNRRVTTQSMGQIIFVQNKNTNWNTYISISDFRSLNGKGTIPASSIKIDPGLPTLLSQENTSSQITTGETQNLESGSDQALLVNIQPNSDEDAIFVLNPRVTIEIPSGTNPGIYQADITFRTI